MDADGGELDWEILQLSSNSDSESVNDFEEEEVDSHVNTSGIQTNYFSIESGEERYAKAISEASESSDNPPSWIEPTSDNDNQSKSSPSSWSSDSVTDPVDLEEVIDKPQAVFRGIEEFVGANRENLEDDDKMGVAASEIPFGNFEEGLNDNDRDLKVGDDSTGAVNVVEAESGKVEEGDKRKPVGWWKVPMELIKFCVFRVNPLWTFSTAAAFIGFVFLGKRLYDMKKKAKALQLKATMDDKKVSQFMSRTARLNEAFSAVKRVPVIRPTYPVVGVTPWPVMSLR